MAKAKAEATDLGSGSLIQMSSLYPEKIDRFEGTLRLCTCIQRPFLSFIDF